MDNWSVTQTNSKVCESDFSVEVVLSNPRSHLLPVYSHHSGTCE